MLRSDSSSRASGRARSSASLAAPFLAAAVRAFQASNQYFVDGQVGTQTRAAIEEALARLASPARSLDPRSFPTLGPSGLVCTTPCPWWRMVSCQPVRSVLVLEHGQRLPASSVGAALISGPGLRPRSKSCLLASSASLENLSGLCQAEVRSCRLAEPRLGGHQCNVDGPRYR